MSCAGSTIGCCYAAGWARRVMNNGAARPSQNTVDAAAVFYDALVSASILSKMIAVNFHAPDSLMAARTPFIRELGLDPWTNVSNFFVEADLTVNGLAGNAANKALFPDINVNSIPAFDFGMTVYITGSNNTTENCGGIDGLGRQWTVGMYNNNVYGAINGIPYIQAYNASALYTGYVSANRLANNDLKVFTANSGTAHNLFASLATVVTDERAATGGLKFYEFVSNNNGALGAYTARRHSFWALHNGLTQAQSLNFYNAIQALRTSLGGGFA